MNESFDDCRNREVVETADYETQLVGFREALEIAKSAWDEGIYGDAIDYCYQTEDANLFSRSDYRSIGGPGPVLVYKLGDELGNYAAYNLEGEHGFVREGFLSDIRE